MNPSCSFLGRVFACRPGLAPAGDLLFFASPKNSKEKKGDPMVWVPCAALRGDLRCSAKTGSGTNSASPQTSASPDPLLSALLGPARRVGMPKAGSGAQRHDALRASCQSQAAVMFARSSRTRGHIKSPAIVQRGEGREWGVAPTGKCKPLSQRDTDTRQSAAPPVFGLARKSKGTSRGAAPDQQSQANHLPLSNHAIETKRKFSQRIRNEKSTQTS
jgi:hypothetical protein